jgi:hypothetical protein
MFSRLGIKSGVLLFIVLIALLVLSIIPNQGQSFFFEPRSITVSNGSPNALVSHSFIMAPPTANNIGSITFEYCNNSPLVFVACNPPPGLDVSGTSLVSQSGNTGFSIDTADSTTNKIVLTRASAPGIMIVSGYNFNNIINPSTPGQTVYVRLATYASSDGSGPLIDKGGVTFTVQSVFNVGAYVPPFLQLCVGVTVTPNCSLIVGDSIDLGTLRSTQVSTGQSQFSTATNDPTGYIIYALGNTMTSGTNTIAALGSPSPSFPGTAQFGFNLRSNLVPAVGQNPVGTGTGTPTPNYNILNRFTFIPGDSIASSSLNSNYNRMSVSYIVNRPAGQTPGVYATTITYLATVQF